MKRKIRPNFKVGAPIIERDTHKQWDIVRLEYDEQRATLRGHKGEIQVVSYYGLTRNYWYDINEDTARYAASL